MSQASERKAMRDLLMDYSLMSLPQIAQFFDCDPRTAAKWLEEWGVPDIRGKYDPVDVAAGVLAEREGISFAEYESRHGSAVADHVRRYMARIRKATAA